MKIYLLNPPFLDRFIRSARWQAVGRGRTFYYPIWLAYAAGALEEEGRQIKLTDAPILHWREEDVARDVSRFNPDLAVIDSSFCSLSNDIDMAWVVKRASPGTITVLVGPPASRLADRILSRSGVDIVARYEYDLTLRDIAQSLETDCDFSAVKGISYLRDGKINHNPDRAFTSSEELDRIPFVSRVYKRHLNIKDYALDHTLYPEVQIFTGRGCPNQCTFCSWPETLMGRSHRVRSVASVVNELAYISRELPQVKEIFIEDDTFTIDTKRTRAICDEIKERKLKITWSCNARANLDYETMKIMKQAGCRLLDVGYESGSDQILRNIKKGISTERMLQFSRDARRAGLMVLGDFVFGFPGETRETAESTIRFAKKLRPNIAQFAVSTPIPGTGFHNWCKENNFLLTDDMEKALDNEGFQKCIIAYPEFSNQDVERYVDKALKRYYLSLSYVPIALGNIFRKNGLHELTGMIKSARVFLRYLRRNARQRNPKKHLGFREKIE